MQPEAAERRRRAGRRRSGEAGQSRAEPRGGQPSPEEERTRLEEVMATMQQAGGEEEEGRGRDRRRREREVRSRRAASEGGEGGGEGGERCGRSLRLRVHQLEKEKLELTSTHNQELCRLQEALTRLRSSVERGEAQQVELQYRLTVSQRDGDRAAELLRDHRTLTERAAELQNTVQELHRTLDITRTAREQDQHALQQEVEERDTLIHNLSSENQRLLRLLQEQEEALEESHRRRTEEQREREKEEEVNRRQADQLKYLVEREERSRREKEQCDERLRCLEASLEAERAAHLESKFTCELLQLRGRDLEAALEAGRSVQLEAQRGLELLRSRLREVEREKEEERERSSSALQRLQTEYEQSKADLSVAMETERTMTSDLTERLEEEKRRHANTHTLLEQEVQRRSDTEERLEVIRETLQRYTSTGKLSTGTSPPAKDDGKWSPSADVLQLLKSTLGADRRRRETTDGQIQDLLSASERLHQDNQSLRRLTSDQSRQVEESQQTLIKMEEEVRRLRQESSDWSTRSRGLQAELEKEREEREKEREKEREEREKEREKEKEREEREKEREERTAEIQKITALYESESKARLSFLYRVYQRLLAGCVLLDQPQSILGDFTWDELCEVINEQVDQLTSDLQKANHKIAHLQGVCEKKSVCVRELQRSQECVLSRLEESVRRREEAWSSQHTHTVTQLQACRSQCDSLRDHTSSLTSDLSRLRGLLSGCRRESSSFLSACTLLGAALQDAHRRLQALRQQKKLLSRGLEEREQLEEEVRRLAAALGGEEGGGDEEEEEEGRRRAVRRRWRRSVCVVLAVRRWSALSQQTAALFQLEGAGGPAGSGGGAAATRSSEDEELCARWLHSERLSSIILESTKDLQEALTGSSPPDVMSAARSSLSRLLGHLLHQSDVASSVGGASLSDRLRPGLSGLTPPRPNTKALVSSLQQHFLLFSQRLHSAEVERRSLRLEVANLKRGRRQEREDTCRVPAQRFHSVCVELRQALSREQEAQTLLQKQTNQLQALQLRVDAHAAEQSLNTQSLSEARQDATRKERSLRILGKHLSGVQRERKQLEERLRRAEDELRDAARRQDCVLGSMTAAERSYREVRESLVQSRGSLSAQPRPLPLPREHLELSGAESIMGAPEVAACQTLLSSVSQLFHTCSSRIDWLEQEVSAHRSHVTALRGELQDACLRDNLAYVPVAEFPETFPLADVETPQPVPLSDLSKEPSVSLNPAPS